MARPTTFEVLLGLSKAMWAPVFTELSHEDFEKLNTIPYHEALYRREDDPSARILATFRVRRPRIIPTDRITWITESEVHKIHDELIRSFGGESGIRHKGHVAGYLDRAQNSRLGPIDTLPTIFDKAAHLMRSILVGHPYVDGQKRTGLASAFVFLGVNGYALWSRNQMEEVHYAIEVARGEREVADVSDWLQKRVGPLRVGMGNANIVRALGGTKKQLRCWSCNQFVRVVGYHAVCTECKFVYELTARAVGLAEGVGGLHIEARIGLHKIGAGREAVQLVLAHRATLAPGQRTLF